ncbi:type VII secretion-associated serine protease mycosin [Micromonospora globbae]|uniref:type VII secretion-associated serine protease mycosin n=1 Tax=Micromonospora globbae TaxID=1894969 RepID=UPI002E29B6EA|nr:type VII secretion-associated serine protease mycosin [Micromonospora globbae]
MALSAVLALVPACLAPGNASAAASQPIAITDGSERIRSDQWHLRYLKVAEAHRYSRGYGVTVAIPDTGVDPHPDLRSNLLRGTDVIPGGRGDGQEDRDSHGTSMAGLIAAHGQAGNRGALGIAPEAKILPILSSPPDGEGHPDPLAEAIQYAVAHSARVISISSAGADSAQLRQAVDVALAADVVVVAGVGNSPREQTVSYPASHPGVVTVAGIDRNGRHAPISVIGSGIDVAAPAVDIYSTSYDGKYSKGTGTSSATAIVAGAVALIRSKYPHLPAREVVHRLTATAVDKGPPGRDDEYGYGVIDIVAALTADVPPLGFESATASAPAGDGPSAPAAAPGDEAASDRAATVRGLVTLGVIVAAGVTWTIVVRRRRRDDPPPRISR